MMRTIHLDFTRMVSDATSSLSTKELVAFESALGRVADEVTIRTGR
jgi:hypothetical protein